MKYGLLFLILIFGIRSNNISAQMIGQPKEYFQGFFVPETFDSLKIKLENLSHELHPTAKIQFVKQIDLETFFKYKTNSQKDIIDVISTDKGCMITNYHLFARCFSRPSLSNNYKFIEFSCNEEINGIMKHRFQEWDKNEPSNLSIVFDNPRNYLESTSNFLEIKADESIFFDVLPRLSNKYLGINFLIDSVSIKRYQIINYDSKEYDWF